MFFLLLSSRYHMAVIVLCLFLMVPWVDSVVCDCGISWTYLLFNKGIVSSNILYTSVIQLGQLSVTGQSKNALT